MVMMRCAVRPKGVDLRYNRIPNGADSTKAITAPKAATEIVEIEAAIKSPQLMAT